MAIGPTSRLNPAVGEGGDPDMDPSEEKFKYRVEGIIKELGNYFEIRYAQLTRVKPSLASMYADLLWQQMAKVRDVMSHEKMFGPVRVRVGDILASRDEAKRRAIMGPIDQASILNELVPEQEETEERRPGFVVVRNMRALYTSVDPSLGPVIELTDIWLWWDILDAADVFNFKEQKKLIERLRSADITDAMQTHYHDALGRRDDTPLTREEILSYEFGYLESIWKMFTQRREGEESFKMVIKRDPVGGDDSVDDLIVTLSRHITVRRRLASEGGLDDRLREHYARVFKCEPSEVKAEQAIAHEDVAIMRLREDLRLALERGEALGEPYDYKRAQGEQMGRDVEHYRKILPLIDAIVGQATSQVLTAAPTSRTPSRSSARTEAGPTRAEGMLGEQETIADEGPLMF